RLVQLPDGLLDLPDLDHPLVAAQRTLAQREPPGQCVVAGRHRLDGGGVRRCGRIGHPYLRSTASTVVGPVVTPRSSPQWRGAAPVVTRCRTWAAMYSGDGR